MSENIKPIYNEEEKTILRINPEVVQMSESADKDIKRIITTLLYMFKNVNRKIFLKQ